MFKYTNLSAHKPSSFQSLTGNVDALPVIEDYVSFVSDIQKMMFGLGDNPQPLVESAELIESIVLDQMISLLHQANEIRKFRNKTIIGPEDILFLMKKNLKALKRLITYLGVKDEAQLHANALMPINEAIFADPTLDSQPPRIGDESAPKTSKIHEKTSPLEWKKGRKKFCLAYLKKLNIEEADLNQVVDLVKEARLNRANERAWSLSSADYEGFHCARCHSFCTTNLTQGRFVKWLKKRGSWNEEITSPVLDILVYLAKETIACVVDMVFTLREEIDIRHKRNTLLSHPITPDEIHEVIRRCFFLHATSLCGFSRLVSPVHRTRLIAI